MRSAAGDAASPGAPGTYLLRFDLERSLEIEAGRLGTLSLPAGALYYVGSAFGPGGIAARVGRHLRGDGRPHWHVDRLRARVAVSDAWYAFAERAEEHRWAACLAALPGATVVPGFGASDCRCRSHLFHSASAMTLARLREVLAPAHLFSFSGVHENYKKRL